MPHSANLYLHSRPITRVRITTSRLSIQLAPALLAALSLAGCNPPNDPERVSRASGVQIETLAARQTLPIAPLDFAQGGDAPSIDSLDRRSWPTVVDSIGFDGAEFYPTYSAAARAPRYVRETVRQRGAFPTPVSATQTFADDRVLYAAEAIAGPFWAASDVLLFVPRMFITPPWHYARGNTSDDSGPIHQRAPHSTQFATDSRPPAPTTIIAPDGTLQLGDVPRLNIPQPGNAP